MAEAVYFWIRLHPLDVSDIIFNGLSGSFQVHLSEKEGRRAAHLDKVDSFVMMYVPEEMVTGLHGRPTRESVARSASVEIPFDHPVPASEIYLQREVRPGVHGSTWVSLGGTYGLREHEHRRSNPASGEFLVIVVDGDLSDSYAVPSTGNLHEDVEAAIDLALPDEGSKIQWTVVKASDAGAARLVRGRRDLQWHHWTEAPHENPSSFTEKGERMYEEIKRGYAGHPRAKEIAARTVYARAAEGARGLVRSR